MHFKPQASLLLAASITLTIGVSTKAGAQQASLEEVVVTARRYEETIQDAPLAVAVMSSEYLQDQGVSNIQDVIELSPGATWGEFTKAQPALSLRGINGGNFGNSSLESAVQVVVDGVASTKAFMMTPSIFDLERVEIMRGPQGTTFGRNATIGLMHFITARPSQEFESAINLSAGERDMYSVDGFVSGGLSDNVSGRIAFNFEEADGAIEDTITGEALEATQNQSIRGSLLFEPSDTFTAFLKAEYSKDDDLPVVRRGESCTVPWLTSPPYINEYTAECDPWKAQQSPPPPGGFFTERDMTHLTAELTWDISDDITITSVSGYADGDHETVQDVLGTPEVIRDQIVRNDADVLSTELRVDNSASGDAFRWLVGAYYLQDEETRFEDNFDFPARGVGAGRIGPQPEAHLQTLSNTETTSWALFGELSFDLSDRVNLTIGGRYSDDTRDYLYQVDAWGRAGSLTAVGLDGPVARDCALNIVAGLCGTEANPMGLDPTALSRGWDEFTSKISLSYRLTDTSNIYFLYSEGFKSGGFQHDARNLSGLVDNIIEPETSENYEIGWKASYDRARVAVTLFDIEQTDAQNNALINVGTTGAQTTLVLNFGGVKNTGLELEGTWLATDNFILGGSVALYDGELGPGSLIGAALDPSTGMIIGTDVSGQRPNDSPEQTYAIYGEYDFVLGNGSTITVRADWQNRGDVWRRLPGRATLRLDGSGPAFLAPEINNYGFRLTWQSADDRTAVSLWGENLGDEYDWKNVGPPIGFHFNRGSAPRGYAGRSRVGVTANFNF